MSNFLNKKTEGPSLITSNIKIIKIIAIILGILIIIGLIFLFVGLSNSFNKLNENINSKNNNLNNNIAITNEFDFYEPLDAQLISSTLGGNGIILLRYLYKGKNTLIILDFKTKRIKSIITLKKGQDIFEIN